MVVEHELRRVDLHFLVGVDGDQDGSSVGVYLVAPVADLQVPVDAVLVDVRDDSHVRHAGIRPAAHGVESVRCHIPKGQLSTSQSSKGIQLEF